MSWPWRSPEATRQALTAKIRARHSQGLRGQRLRQVAYRRLLARIFATQPERWVVKGGVALLLRLDPNRASNDIDLAYVAVGWTLGEGHPRCAAELRRSAR